MRGSFPGNFLLFLFKGLNDKPHCSVHRKAYITLASIVHHQKHVVLGRDKTYYSIDRPRRERKLPNVLSKEEVGAMLRATKNPKHKCMPAPKQLKFTPIYPKQIFRGSRIHWMTLLEMMNEHVNISTQIGGIYSIKSNDIKEINSMNIVKCYKQAE